MYLYQDDPLVTVIIGAIDSAAAPAIAIPLVAATL